MIFHKTCGKITAAGWSVHSDLLQNDFPLAANSQVGGGSGAVQNLAVPAGLIILQNMIDSNTKLPLNDFRSFSSPNTLPLSSTPINKVPPFTLRNPTIVLIIIIFKFKSC